MVVAVPSLLTWYSPYASVNQLNGVEKPSRDGGGGQKRKREHKIMRQRERPEHCVKGQRVVFWIIIGCWFCVAEGEKQHNTEH